MEAINFKLFSKCILLVAFFLQPIFIYAAAGDLDPTFGIGGKVTTDFIGSNDDYGYDSAIQNDGRIILAGWTDLRDRSSRAILIRLFSDGSLDPTFGEAGKLILSDLVNASFRAVKVQTDGKVLAAGTVGTFSSFDFLIMRFNSDGSSDTSFGTNGMVTLDLDEEDGFNDLAIQTDGKIVAVGATGYFSYDSGHNWWYAIARFNSDGTVDSTFGDGGKVLAFGFNDEGDSANSVSIQPDGKIIAGGNACCDDRSATDFGLVRLNSNGTVDTSFGTNGKVLTDFNKSKDFYSSSDVINSIATQSDGKIVVTGIVGQYYRSKIALARYLPDGSLDTTFGKRGKVLTKISKINRAYDLKLQSDERILVSSVVGRYNALDFALLRYNNDGRLDSSFGNGGIVQRKFSETADELNSVLLLPNENILAFGSVRVQNQLDLSTILYDNSGNINKSFGAEGILTIGFESAGIQYISGLKIDANEKIIVAGFDSGIPNPTPLIVRYLTDGSVDTTFHQKYVNSKLIRNIYNVTDLDLTPEGKIILVGGSYDDDDICVYAARYNLDGSLDRTFGNKGISCIPIPGFSEQLMAVAIQPDSKIVAVGFVTDPDDSNDRFLTIRFNADGSLDDSFGVGGIVMTSLLFDQEQFAFDVAIQQDGRIVVGGYLYDRNNGMGTGVQFALVRYMPDGVLDPDFGIGGIVRTNVSTGSDAINSIVLQNDGKIIAAGYAIDDFPDALSDFALTRYLSDGSLDSTFGSGGIVRSDFFGDERIQDLAIENSGKIVASGFIQTDSQTQFVLARYNDDGSQDNNFGNSGKVFTSFSSGDSYASSVAIQIDGKIVAAGSADMGETFDDFALARYESQ